MADERVLDGGMSIPSVPSGEVGVAFRSGWIRHLRVALSSAGGVAVVLAIFGVLQKQPGAGFGLLASWGPWPILGLGVLWILGRFLSRTSDTIHTTLGGVVRSVQQSAEAQARMAEAGGMTAEALSQLAAQGGRQAEEVKRLAIYAAQEFPGVYQRFDKQDTVLRELSESMKALVRRGHDDH